MMGVEAEGSGGCGERGRGGILLARGSGVRKLGAVMVFLMPLRLMKLSD